MARKGLPKKYAKMGFKKGWREYKKSKRGRGRRKTSTRKNTRKRTYRRKNNMKLGNKAIIGGIAAGAISGAATRYLNVPFVDDVAILGYGMFTNNKTLQTIGAIGLGNDLAARFLPGGNGGGMSGFLGD
jgi:hypothetical protein